MNSRLFLSIVGLFFLAAKLNAETPADREQTAIHEYQEGLDRRTIPDEARQHFRRAAGIYEQIWYQDQIQSPYLARNRAQACLNSGDYARAIQAYHQGLRIDPREPGLRAGLNYCRDQIDFPADVKAKVAARPRNSILLHASATTYGLCVACVYLLALVLSARGWMSRNPLWWIAGGMVLVSALVMWGALVWEVHRFDVDHQRAVAIVSKSTKAYQGNGTTYPSLFTEPLPAGTEMLILLRRGGWIQVQFSNGAIGWIESRSVVTVE